MADSYNKENSQILGDSVNLDLEFSKNNSKGMDFEIINKVDNLLSKVVQQQKEESMINELQKQIKELKLKYEKEKKINKRGKQEKIIMKI